MSEAQFIMPPGVAPVEACSTAAVVVTFNPDEPVFRRLLQATLRQVETVVVVDNGSVRVDVAAMCCSEDAGAGRVRYVPLGTNLGIAAAQNRGIEAARAAGAEYVLLLDHDSVPADNMVAALRQADRQLRDAGVEVGAVGAVAHDRRTGTTSKVVRMVRGRVQRLASQTSEPYIEADFLIASGTMIAISVLERYGMMDEGYFIDHVDTEWCLRVKARGMRLFAIPGARLEHALGDHVVRVWLGRWREVPVHSPARDYYMFRNTVRMLLTTPMSFAWRITHVFRLSQFAVFFGLGMSPRLQRIRLMTRGIIDGIKGRGGALAEARPDHGSNR
ncbi:glycosyltransferase family 2 protein [Cupriavidus taiwanensis]|uniref:glycosyltransferase family 2 protein n=1 Tax=Cupriavidus taiwanensis TaxID=164546 RepID=UPI001572D8FC|nr:glycosyltransferase family 2 protein [Cupriavidus taiwanensis]MDK3021825.1 glycosyltransferase family 2 protein [Cupriavidus taiwanensis]NSX12910.1 glycosyltransferase family 2 protein [Cupriavidus taiwanensis]